jgi:predicted nucleotidyltransferase
MAYSKSGVLETLLPKARREVLTFFMTHHLEENFLRDIARRTNLPIQAVQRETAGLERIGLLRATLKGRQKFFAVNRVHPIFPELHALVIKTSGIVEPLREILTGAKGIDLALVFGSQAAGTETADSDVDLMIVGTISPRKASDLLADLPQRLGREINPVVMTPEEFAARRRKKDHFLTTVLSAPKLMAIGTDDDLARLGT